MRITLVTFATAGFKEAQKTLCEDAIRTGVITDIVCYDDEILKKTPEYESLPLEIKSGRAFGYFWWKACVIRMALEAANEGDLIFYTDSGRYDGGFRLGKGLKWLIERYSETGFVGVEVPQFGPSVRWTKMDCFVGLSREIERDMELPQIQATFSLWRNCNKTRSFVRVWETACRDPRLVADDPSTSERDSRFIAHRHDQSILTILARQLSMHYLQPAARWEEPILRRLAKTHEANVCFKQTGFVVSCLRMHCASILLGWRYFCRKAGIASAK